MNLSNTLIEWYEKNKRELPWRNTKDPYKIWVSEIILQQTRVVQGIDYYLHFMQKFPNIYSLAHSTEDEVMKSWQGLGYYTRARNLHASAKYIVHTLQGNFPKCYKDLLLLKGIGTYTAAAIVSLAFNEKVPALDANAYRVLSRIFKIYCSINSNSDKKKIFALAKKNMGDANPGVFNQALIEFGALQCIPKNPDCESCILAYSCIANKEDIVHILPVKKAKSAQRKRYFYYLVIQWKNRIAIQKRIKKDIWNFLYEFPLIETKKKTSLEKLIRTKAWNDLIGTNTYFIQKASKTIEHQLSHQLLICKFIHLSLDSRLNYNNEWELILPEEIETYAFPTLISKYLTSNPL